MIGCDRIGLASADGAVLGARRSRPRRRWRADARRSPPMPIPSDPRSSAPAFEGERRHAEPDRRRPSSRRGTRSWRRTGAPTSTTTPTRPTPTRSAGRSATAPRSRPSSSASARSVTFDSPGPDRDHLRRARPPGAGAARSRTRSTCSRRCRCRRATLAERLGNPFTDFSGGGYFYLDHRDRAVLSTRTTATCSRSAITAGPGLRDHARLRPLRRGRRRRRDHLGAARLEADASGSSPARALVGTIDRDSGDGATRCGWRARGSRNSFAVDETGGVFIVSDEALYRFDAGQNGEPDGDLAPVLSRLRRAQAGPERRRLGHHADPDGARGWVTITDNADPMNIQVYRRGQAARARPRRSAAQALRKARSPKARQAAEAALAQPPARGLHRAGLREGRRLHRPVADRRRQLDHRREQLRLLGRRPRPSSAARPQPGPGARRRGREAEEAKRKGEGQEERERAKRKRKAKRFVCRTVWTSQERAPSVVPEALARQRARLHVHEAADLRRATTPGT